MIKDLGNYKIIIDGCNVKECRHCMYKGFKAFPQCKLELDSFATACEQHKDCEYKQLQRLKEENERLKHVLEEIREIAKVNAITTCWSVLNFCDECKEDCEDQSPFIKLKEIVDKINEVLKED